MGYRGPCLQSDLHFSSFVSPDLRASSALARWMGRRSVEFCARAPLRGDGLRVNWRHGVIGGALPDRNHCPEAFRTSRCKTGAAAIRTSRRIPGARMVA